MADIQALVGPPAGRNEDGVKTGPNDRGYTAFQHLCLLRAVRPDAVVPEVQAFVKDEMGARFIEVPQFDLGACYDDSKCFTPLLFVLTPGADPMSALFALAEEKGFGREEVACHIAGPGPGRHRVRRHQRSARQGHLGLFAELPPLYLLDAYVGTLM